MIVSHSQSSHSFDDEVAPCRTRAHISWCLPFWHQPLFLQYDGKWKKERDPMIPRTERVVLSTNVYACPGRGHCALMCMLMFDVSYNIIPILSLKMQRFKLGESRNDILKGLYEWGHSKFEMHQCPAPPSPLTIWFVRFSHGSFSFGSVFNFSFTPFLPFGGQHNL